MGILAPNGFFPLAHLFGKFVKDITDWSTLQVLQADMRVSTCNDKVRKVMSDTGILLYEKSVRSEKDDLEDAECVLRHAEKLSDLFYPVIDTT